MHFKEIFNEIQTEHLPLMLKRIIQTLNDNCAQMTNQDLSKSLFLCLKILKKVIPKIAVPDTKQQSGQQQQQNQTTSKKDQRDTSKNPAVKSLPDKQAEQPQSTKTSEQLENLEKDEDKSDETIVADVLNEIISLIENKEITGDLTANTANGNITDATFSPEPKKSTPLKIANSDEDRNNDVTIENCVFHLKQLTHTFIKSHLFKIEPTNSENSHEDSINKSFSSLFYSNQIKTMFNLNDDGYLVDDFQDYFKAKVATPTSTGDDQSAETTTSSSHTQNQAHSPLAEIIHSIQHLILNERTVTERNDHASEIILNKKSFNSLSSVYFMHMKHDCLNYLQSFQILNKLLIKMFFFPREQKLAQTHDQSDLEESAGN